MNRRTVIVTVIILICGVFSVFGNISMVAGEQGIHGTTISGTTGHIVTPSADLFWDDSEFALSTGYTMIATKGKLAHVPYVNFALFRNFETTIALDTFEGTFDVLTGAKWRFLDTGNTMIAVGLLGQSLDIGNETEWAAQAYLTSTFKSSFFDQSALTTVLIGYTFQKDMKFDIDFSVGFDTLLFPSVLKEYVSLVFDVGNVSYSNDASGTDPDRGIINAGLRLNPIGLGEQLRISADIAGLDLLDGADRSFALGVNLQMKLR